MSFAAEWSKRHCGGSVVILLHPVTSSAFLTFSGYMGTCIAEWKVRVRTLCQGPLLALQSWVHHVTKTLQLLNILQSQVTWGVLINWVSFVDGCYCLFKKEQPPGNAQRPNAHHLPVQKSVARNACVTLAPGKQHQAGKPVAVVHSPSLAWNLKYNWVVFIPYIYIPWTTRCFFIAHLKMMVSKSTSWFLLVPF